MVSCLQFKVHMCIVHFDCCEKNKRGIINAVKKRTQTLVAAGSKEFGLVANTANITNVLMSCAENSGLNIQNIAIIFVHYS